MDKSINKFLHGTDKLTEFNFDATFDAFVSVVHSIIENHAPLKRLSRKEQKVKRKPWITKDIYAMIRRKNIMHKSHDILGNETMKQEYKKYSNKLTKIKSTAKKQYYAKELEATTGNPRGKCCALYSQVIQRNLQLYLLLLI